ncbi:DUF6368 family protein [Streptomyces sp. NPDC046385]|uniref:DUF6368 family protein n=1 Tax=Streptomyces sp. NPDC046385 TaxID=3154918 RepID=UPI0033CCBB07
MSDVVPWLETFCDPVETQASGDVNFWVRDGSALGLRSFDPAGVGVFFLSEDEEMPAEDEDYSAFSRPPVQGLVVGAGCSGSVNHVLLGHLALALARRLDALVDFDGLLGSHPAAGDDTGHQAVLARARMLASALPGNLAEVSYDTGGGERWLIIDQFLRAYVDQPDSGPGHRKVVRGVTAALIHRVEPQLQRLGDHLDQVSGEVQGQQ